MTAILVLPADSKRKVVHAAASDADEIVLDLEDAIATDRKADARGAALDALREAPFRVPVAVRVNAVGTPWCHDDIVAVIGTRATSIVVPKVESPSQLHYVDGLLDAVDTRRAGAPLRLQILIETPAGVMAARELAATSPRVSAVIFGPIDYAASLGLMIPDSGARGSGVAFARAQLALAARASGRRAIDGPHAALTDTAAVNTAAAEARELGFEAKWCIHPRQLAPVRKGMAPTEDEVAQARRLLGAHDAAVRAGDGATGHDDSMIDHATRRIALSILGNSSHHESDGAADHGGRSPDRAAARS
jgi:citrate lyase beta subunit